MRGVVVYDCMYPLNSKGRPGGVWQAGEGQVGMGVDLVGENGYSQSIKCFTCYFGRVV